MFKRYETGSALFAIAFILSFILPSVAGSPSRIHHLPRDLVDFEVSFTKTLQYKCNSGIKMIGYTTIKVPPDEVEAFEAHYTEYYYEWKNISHMYYERDIATMRLYFPVNGALLEHGNTIIEANHLGEAEIPCDTLNWDDLAVVGRRQTEDVRGVSHNIIKDGIIYLARKNRPHHRFDNVFVFSFGEKVLHDHDHEKRNEEGNVVPCMQNHGGPNCSDKFKIYMGRCPFIATWCMDYNGWFTDCVKVQGNILDPAVAVPKLQKFAGSDCDYAAGQGNCWNEYM
jgi:hypothetical protein